jgi:hypothetical protein
MSKKAKPKAKRKKPAGRPADRLIITDDPQAALDRLLKKKPQ